METNEKNEVRISIHRTGMTSNPDKTSIEIEIEDKTSGLKIIKLTMTPEEFGMLLASSEGRTANITLSPSQFIVDNIGKERESKGVFLKAFRKWDYSEVEDKGKETIRMLLTIGNHLVDGWTIHCYGLNTQQNDPRGHQILLKRYVTND